jgi:hypothetical protein
LWNSFVSSAFNVLLSFSNDIDTNKTTPKNNEYSRRPEASGGFSGQLHSDNNSDDTLAEDILSERMPMMKHCRTGTGTGLTQARRLPLALPLAVARAMQAAIASDFSQQLPLQLQLEIEREPQVLCHPAPSRHWQDTLASADSGYYS